MSDLPRWRFAENFTHINHYKRMPHNYIDSHAHHIFPPARSIVPRSSGGFLSYGKETRTQSKNLPPISHATTALLTDDIEERGLEARLSRFASMSMSQSGLSTANASVVKSVTSSVKKGTVRKGKRTNAVSGHRFAPPLVQSFDSALNEAHRLEMAATSGPKVYATAETMTSNDPSKLEFDDMTAFNGWMETTIDPFLKNLRRMLMICKPSNYMDFIAGFCYREALGQPHPTDMARFSSQKSNKGGGPGGSTRRQSAISVPSARQTHPETTATTESAQGGAEANDRDGGVSAHTEESLENLTDAEHAARDGAGHVRRYAMVTPSMLPDRASRGGESERAAVAMMEGEGEGEIVRPSTVSAAALDDESLGDASTGDY